MNTHRRIARGLVRLALVLAAAAALPGPAAAQSAKTVYVPVGSGGSAPSAPDIATALTMLDPAGGTIRVTKTQAYPSDPGFAATGFTNLTLLGPELPVTATSAFTGCKNVRVNGFSFEMGLLVDTSEAVELNGPLMKITGGLWIDASSRVRVRGVKFTGAGSPGAVIAGCMGPPTPSGGLAALGRSWGSSFYLQVPEAAVQFLECRFESLGPPPAVSASGSHVRLQSCRFTDLAGAGVEGLAGSAVHVMAGFFRNLHEHAIYFNDSLGHVSSTTIQNVLPGTFPLGRGIEAVNTGPNLAGLQLGPSAAHTVVYGANVDATGIGIVVFNGKGQIGRVEEPEPAKPLIKNAAAGMVFLDNFQGSVSGAVIESTAIGAAVVGCAGTLLWREVYLAGTRGASFVVADCPRLTMEKVRVVPQQQPPPNNANPRRGGVSLISASNVLLKDVQIESTDGAAGLTIAGASIVRAEPLLVQDVGGHGIAMSAGTLAGTVTSHTNAGAGLQLRGSATATLTAGLLGANAGGELDAEGAVKVQLTRVRLDHATPQRFIGVGIGNIPLHPINDRNRWRPYNVRLAGGAALMMQAGIIRRGGDKVFPIAGGEWTGILIESGGQATVRSATLDSVRMTPKETGIVVRRGGRLEITGANLNRMEIGIDVEPGAEAQIKECQFYDVNQKVRGGTP